MKDILAKLHKVISYQENPGREEFILKENQFDQQASGDQGRQSLPKASGVTADAGGDNQARNNPGSDDKSEGCRKQHAAGGNAGSANRMRRPRKTKRPGAEQPVADTPDNGTSCGGKEFRKVSASLENNRRVIEKLYGVPVNNDLIIREFTVDTEPPVNSFIAYIDGLADRKTINSLLQDLMIFSGKTGEDPVRSVSSIMKRLLPGNQIKVFDSFEKIVDAVNYGDTAFFFEGLAKVLIVETKGWEARNVDRPQTEQTIIGPQEGFTENLRTNTAMIRRIIRSEKLYTEILRVGSRITNYVAVMYLEDLANPELVAEVKRRISGIRTDYIIDSGILEQYIEDSPYNINSQVISTERPDRVASYLAEGKVAVILSGSPHALVVPATMFAQLHTGEETYLRWQYGTFIRYIRTFSFYLALLLPGIYIAIVLYHQEMIPTELLLAIAGSRERVPFPTTVELLLLEFSFELVREAGVRIPGVIGNTVGIVGALILGQAAVQANIVSPILVILVAATGLGSFAIPSHSLAFAVRIYRFAYIFLGAVLGLYGIAVGLFVHIIWNASLKSFGVPYLAPAGPRTYTGGDVVWRMPVFNHRRRPDYVNPQDDIRMPEEPRKWLKEGGNDGGGAG